MGLSISCASQIDHQGVLFVNIDSSEQIDKLFSVKGVVGPELVVAEVGGNEVSHVGKFLEPTEFSISILDSGIVRLLTFTLAF